MNAKDEKSKSRQLQMKIEKLEQEVEDLKMRLEDKSKADLDKKLEALRERSLGEGSISRRYQSMSLDKRRDSVQSDMNSMFCPLTQNKKFE